MELANKVAIVTGAGGKGCGRADARRFAHDGAAVVVADVDEAGGRETVRLIEVAGGRAAFCRTDVGVEAEVRALLAFADKAYGGVDIIVNNASFPYHPQEPFGYWRETIQVDLLGPLFATLHGLEALRRRGGGAIVNIGSTSALGHGRNHAHVPAFDVAKAGIIRLTTALAGLREREGIRVNCLVPGWIATPEVQGYVDSLTPPQRRERGVPDVLITLDEIADAVVQLATDESLAGRIMVCWNGQPRRLIAHGDRGYAELD
jgi:NAD(P)-dependent dehydrogenase (short-subunit alcohol dehydrogenase family)